MSKLFEIPIYAFSPEAFRKRVNARYESMIRKFYAHHEPENDERIKERFHSVFHPNELWTYNHIVGFIVISFENPDILFELFLQAHGSNHKSKYYWNSSQKWYLENQGYGGWHFRLDDKYTSDEIREIVHSWLEGMIKELVPSKYYVDHEAFDTVDRMVDYKLLLKGE